MAIAELVENRIFTRVIAAKPFQKRLKAQLISYSHLGQVELLAFVTFIFMTHDMYYK